MAMSIGNFILGSYNQIYVSKKRSTFDRLFVDHHLAGFTSIGAYSDIWSKDSWGDNVDEYGATYGGVQNSGVLCTGRECTLSLLGQNYGVTLTGLGTVLDNTVNQGVFISGAVSKKSAALFDKDHNRVSIDGTAVDHHDCSLGSGIYIRGCVYDFTLQKVIGNSLIQFSSYYYPTIFKGNIELDKSFSVKDAQGNYIIRNGVRQS